jgi:hypothetical protein
MNKPPIDDEASPKGTPNSDRHQGETAVHDPKDHHMTDSANAASKDAIQDDLSNQKRTGPGSRGKRR